jgi:DNA polymerase-3 subunit gamma/tau
MADADLEPESAERDPDTSDMFGEPAPSSARSAAAPGYTVIARKYRPRSFDDLIGQEAMVRTLKNAFATGRIAHAFMLTGVRGVGKTTTARLLARALNYESDTVHQPSIEAVSVAEGIHCPAIIEGRHMDVQELDAASHNGVAEMRDLLDRVRYGPVEARYKVYIVDEVHMLSTAAFNALLKTLEEPPPHTKFIFATTEIRKVPVTILSRCQRYDLRRVEPPVIEANLAQIATREGFRVEAEGLTLIARAAEGSVRDAQSLLDQALVQVEPGQPVTGVLVQDMLGLADRSQTIDLFEKIVRGEAGPAIEAFRTLYGYGADPATVMNDLLEHGHAASIAKMLGPEALTLPKDQAARLTQLGVAVPAGTLARLWSMLLRALEEVRGAPDPAAAVEMALIRLAYAADLPGPEEALKALRAGEGMPSAGPVGKSPQGGGGGAAAAVRAQPVAAVAEAQLLQPRSFDDVVALIERQRDIALKMDVERFVRPISFRPGAITFEPAPGAPNNLAQRLVGRLKEWTGQPWLVVAETGGGAETLREKEQREKAAVRREIEDDPFIRSVMEAFPGAEIVEVRHIPTPEADPAPIEDDEEDDA